MSQRWKDSLLLAFAIVTGIATAFTILGFSMKDLIPLCTKPLYFAVVVRLLIACTVFAMLTLLIWARKGKKYKDSISLNVGENRVIVKEGDIFKENGWRVIPCETTFSTEVGNVISSESLHGKFVSYHADATTIEAAVTAEIEKRNILPDQNGNYRFELGTVIPCMGTDGNYLMVALNELNSDFEARTTMPKYEQALMRMWRELSKVYNGKPLFLPVLGDGMTRFDDGEKETLENLLRCMLCTLKTSREYYNTQISIVLYSGDDNKSKLQIYECKKILRVI